MYQTLSQKYQTAQDYVLISISVLICEKSLQLKINLIDIVWYLVVSFAGFFLTYFPLFSSAITYKQNLELKYLNLL